MNLYEINAAIMDCMNEVDEETGELLNAEKLDELMIAREEKLENIALWIKNLNAEAAALKAEKDAFDKRKKAAENKAEQLKRYLSSALAGEKFKTERVAISYRSSQSVVIDDWTQLDESFLKYKEPDIDKVALKAALKGKEIAGAHLEEKQNIQIK